MLILWYKPVFFQKYWKSFKRWGKIMENSEKADFNEEEGRAILNGPFTPITPITPLFGRANDRL